MSVKKRGNVWQVDVRLEGYGRLRPTFQSEREALEWVADAKHSAKMGRPLPNSSVGIKKGGGTVRTLEDLFKEQVLSWEMEGIVSLPDQMSRTREFLDWFGGQRQPSEVTERVVDEYNAYLWNDIGNSGATINRKNSMIRNLLNRALRYRLIEYIPQIKRFKESKGSLNFFNFGEEEPVIRILEHRGYTELADLVRFLVDTGCRVTEAISVEWSTIRNGRVTFENRKNGQFGTVPATKRVLEVLERRRSTSKHPERPFGGINTKTARTTMRDVYDSLGGNYPKVTQPFHVYRHSCASRLAIRGVDARRIMEWMDHSSLAVTQRYMKLSVVSLDEAVNALDDASIETRFNPTGTSKPVTKPVTKRSLSVQKRKDVKSKLSV